MTTSLRSIVHMKNALIVWGGWDGHEPEKCADLWAGILSDDFNLTVKDSLDAFTDEALMKEQDVIIPIWTMGEISGEQSKGLRETIAAGCGLAGFHGGMGDAFRNDTEYQWMVGGQFVSHPGDIKEYTVEITNSDDPITKGLSSFKMNSEQYLMHVDPSNEVIANTTFDCKDVAPWSHGTVMPVVWKRMWNKGKVFYSSLGHVATDFDVEEAREIQKRGTIWAAK